MAGTPCSRAIWGIAQGAFGPLYADEFTRELATRSRGDISLRHDLLQRLEAARGSPPAEPRPGRTASGSCVASSSCAGHGSHENGCWRSTSAPA